MTACLPCIDVIGNSRCTGCFGCQSACAMDAIKLALDDEGFYKPVVDYKACNECGICQRRCPVIAEQESTYAADTWAEPKAFAAWSNDESVRLASSSGGVFSELARQVIDAGGAVAGCVWGEKWTPEHVLTRTWSEVERMRGSKYVPSHVGDVYQEVISFLMDNDKPVLFSGTPCQVAAMEAALRPEQRQRVVLVEFICHGVPSLRVFHRYLEELFEGDTVTAYTFRDKALGWQTVKAVSAQGKLHHVSAPNDPFFQGFVRHHIYVMEACYQCPFARIPRGGDITIGDFWGCPEQWHDKRGVSLVLTNTDAGLKAVESASAAGRIAIRSTEFHAAISHCLRANNGRSYSLPSERRGFLDRLARGDRFEQLIKRYFPSRRLLLWKSFRASKSRVRFIASLLYRCIQRMF